MKKRLVVVLLVFILITGCTQEPPREEAIDLGPPPSPPITTDAPPSPPPTESIPPTTVDRWSSPTPATSTSGLLAVSPVEAYEHVQDHSGDPTFIIIDMRTPSERAASRFPYGSVHIDFEAQDFEEELKALSKDDTYLIYCQTGSRTPGALETMDQMGFNTVYELEGGIVAWEEAGFDVER